MEAIRSNSNSSIAAPEKVRAKEPYNVDKFLNDNTIVSRKTDSRHTIRQPVTALSLSGETTKNGDGINSRKNSLGSTSQRSSVTDVDSTTAIEPPYASHLSTHQTFNQISVLCEHGRQQECEREKRDQANLDQIESLKTDLAVAEEHIAGQEQTIKELNQQISNMVEQRASLEAANDNSELLSAVETLVETLVNALASFNAAKAQATAK